MVPSLLPFDCSSAPSPSLLLTYSVYEFVIISFLDFCFLEWEIHLVSQILLMLKSLSLASF